MTHNDVKPTNFVVKPDCGAQEKEMTGSTYGFTLVDFGCATNNDVSEGRPVTFPGASLGRRRQWYIG